MATSARLNALPYSHGIQATLNSPPATFRVQRLPSHCNFIEGRRSGLQVQSQCRTLNPVVVKNVAKLHGIFKTNEFPTRPCLRSGRASFSCQASTVSERVAHELSSSSRAAHGKPFKNRLLGISKFGSVINDAAESFFKSEIRRRIFVIVALILASRVGYFIPIPGFDRRFMPGDYLALVSGAVEELGDSVAELKLAVFQLGISPYIFSSIVMEVACHLIPSLSKLRKEGLDGNEKVVASSFYRCCRISGGFFAFCTIFSLCCS